MGLLDRIKGNPFEKLKDQEILEEKIRLEREEKLKAGEFEKLEKQKKQFFEKGFGASKAEQRQLARKITQVDRKIKQQNIHLKKISDQIRVVDNLAFIKENQSMLQQEGLISRVNKMKKADLNKWLAKVNIADTVANKNVGVLLSTMDSEYGLMGEISEDSETQGLMDVWGTGDVEDVDEAFEKWDKKKTQTEEDDEMDLL